MLTPSTSIIGFIRARDRNFKTATAPTSANKQNAPSPARFCSWRLRVPAPFASKRERTRATSCKVRVDFFPFRVDYAMLLCGGRLRAHDKQRINFGFILYAARARVSAGCRSSVRARSGLAGVVLVRSSAIQSDWADGEHQHGRISYNLCICFGYVYRNVLELAGLVNIERTRPTNKFPIHHNMHHGHTHMCGCVSACVCA